MKKRNIVLLVPFLLLILILYNYFNIQNKHIVYKTTISKIRDFDLILQQRGVLEASRFVQIKSTILSNRAKIVELVTEGKFVSKGEIIARFDIKPFMDELIKWQYKIKEVKATVVKSQKELDIHKNQTIQDKEKIKKSIEIAEINLDDIKNGSGQIALNELIQKVAQEKRKISLAQEELDDYSVLLKQGYISKRELDKIDDKFQIANESLTTANEKLINYKKYDWTKQIKEQEIKLKELKEQLINKNIQNEFLLQSKIATVKKTESILSFNKKEFKKAKNNVSDCDVRSSIDGIVLYNKIPKNGKQSKVDIGDSVWQNQAFIQIPDTNNMIVKTNIREIDLNKIKNNLEVNIVLDAYPQKLFKGKIKRIDSIAKKDDTNINIKFFETIIEVLNKDKILRSGMSVKISIVYEKVKGVMSLPIDTINYDGQKEYIQTINNSEIQKQNITIGKIGEKYIEIKEGLQQNIEVIIR